jgi:PAS domain S-box-containing protein
MISRGYIVREPNGEVLRMIGAMTDVTERRNAEHAMASLHRQKEMILNSVGDGIFGLDAIGNIVSVNPAGIAMLGGEESDALGKPVTDVVHCGDAEKTSLIFTTLREGTLQSSDEEFFRRADRSSFPGDYVSNAMCDDAGNVVGAVVTFRDITERHEIARLKSQFVSTVSHELRTPLTSIRGALGLLSGGLLGNVSPKGQRMLEIAVSNTDRLVRLINDILDVERIDSQAMKMAGAVVDAFDLMKRAVESVQSIADVAGVRLVLEPAPVSILGDADRLIQTLTNLIGNAIKFSPRDTTVTVSACAAGDKCTFRVADEGRGLPADKLEMIFERFQQLDASDSRDKGGSGLGLAICRSIVTAHGGRIWAEKNEPAGSVFQFTIPLAIAQAPGAEAKARTLLVCQESDSAMPGIVRMLEGEGFEVLRCFESEITARVAETQPDAVVLNLASNGGHGWQVVEALKSDPETRDVPIVVATMQSPESWEHYATAVASWVRKPFGCRDLLDAVTAACSGPSILVVEDDADLAKVLTAILQTHGIRTFHAANGRDAVELCRQHEPSLIVLDLILPDMDGFAVVCALRESAALRRIPLLVYSGLDVDTADQARLRLGPTEFLIKSQASLAEFESRVVRLLDTMTTTNAEASHAA